MDNITELVDRHLSVTALYGELRGLWAAMDVVWAGMERHDATTLDDLWHELRVLHDRKGAEVNAAIEAADKQIHADLTTVTRSCGE